MVDECISPYLARALRELFYDTHTVEHIRDRFPPQTTDREWIVALSNEGGWVILSADRRISRNKAELHAFRSSKMVGFFLSRTVNAKPVHRQLIRILQVWDGLEAQTKLVRPGAMFEISERGDKFRSL